MKPIIGITLDYQTKSEEQGGYSNFPWYALRTHYAKAVTDAGGIAVLIPYEKDSIQNYIDICDGFIFPGGDYDINPAFYGETVEPETELLTDDRVNFEASLMKSAMANKMPILGICAGHQLLNVVCGGTLYQAIRKHIPGALEHKHKMGQSELCHKISISNDSLLHKIVGTDEYMVNSNHRQAVRKPGKDLIITAIAPDGVVEAIEHQSLPFCLGVEWHPEYQQHEEDRAIFRGLLKAALLFKQERVGIDASK